jgi:predicted TIM-barrel fold metal-dependent hydrolase
MQFIEEIKMPPADRRQILYENAARIFRIPLKRDPTSIMNLLRPR